MEFAQLLQAARDGRSEALGELLEGCRRALHAIAARQMSLRLRTKVVPADLVQQTFLEACRDFPKFSGHSRAEFLSWLCRMLSGNIQDAHRRYCACAKRNIDRETALDSVTAAATPVGARAMPIESLIQRENAETVLRAVYRLPENYRIVIILHDYEQLEWPEIAERLKKTLPAIRRLRHRAIRRLRAQLTRKEIIKSDD